MSSIDWKTLSAITAVLSLLNAGLFWAVRWLVESQRQAFERRFEDLIGRLKVSSEDVHEVRRELYELKAELPRTYVQRDDWIMSFGRFEQKLDGIWNFVHELRDRLDGGADGP